MAKRRGPRDVFEEADAELGSPYGETAGTFPPSIQRAIRGNNAPRDNDEDEDDYSGSCPTCGGELLQLGRMGRRVHSRCRNCGMDSSHEA